MSQLVALIWLKWMLFRNTLRSRKAVVSRVASTLGTLAALVISLAIASGLGFATYFLTSPQGINNATAPNKAQVAAFLFLLTSFTLLYFLWAVVPLGIGGGGNEFDPGRLLLYPVSLRKLFAIDLLSELSSLASIFAMPVVLAMTFAAGLANGKILPALIAGVWALAFGIAFAKLLSTSVGALMRKRRTRGETVLAVLGAVAGLSGAFLGQLAPVFVRYAESLRGLRWTPPGAVAIVLTDGLQPEGANSYLLAIATLAAYTFVFVVVTYWMAQRAALKMDGVKRSAAKSKAEMPVEDYTGWNLPVLSSELSAVVEKELRYALRNAQVRVLMLMPLILLGVRRMMQSGNSRGESNLLPQAGSLTAIFTQYGEGVLAATGVLYVFTILSSIGCNLFAFEEGGMRAFILSPLKRGTILLGKNIAVTLIALVLALPLIIINQIFFRDTSALAMLFAALCFVLFAATFALIGNLLSIHFPKRLKFGKRLNASGVTGLLVLPLLVVMMMPPLASVAAGYLARSLAVKYVTLASFAAVAVALYMVLIKSQGRALARREIDILEAVSGRAEN